MNTQELLNDKSALANTQDIMKDIMAGDDKAYELIKSMNLDMDAIKTAVSYLVNNPKLDETEKLNLVNESWRINYRRKPPTPEEFITTDYLGPVALHTFDRVKNAFKEFMDPSKNYRNLILYPHIGWGKLLYSQEKVMVPEGYRKIEDMKVGDTVLTPDCGTAKVKAVNHYPDAPIYRITFGDGRTVLAGGPHYWKAARNYDNSYWDKEQKKYVLYPKSEPKRPSWKIITTEEILKDMEAHPGQNRGWFIPLTEPAQHIRRDHVIPPYTVGALLGDGSMHCEIAIGNDDKEIINRLIQEATDRGWNITYDDWTELKERKGSSVKYHLRYRKTPEFERELDRLNLRDTYSHNKFIPDEYKYDSIENRIALLQGMMDTDGSVECKNTCPRASYYTKSERLKDDFVELCSGLGAARCVVTRGNDGVFRITVTFPDNSFPIFGLKRKQQYIDAEYSKSKLGYKQQRKPQVLHIKSIERTDLKGGVCIETDDAERLFLTSNYIVTHNSYLSTMIILYTTTCISLMRDPWNYFGLNPATVLAQALASYSQKKSSELLLEPFNSMLEASPFFEKVKMKEQMREADEAFREADHIDKIYYTTASPTSAMSFSGGVNIKLASSNRDILGLSLLGIVFSELAFFTDAGKTSEWIMSFYNSGKARIKSRLHGDYYGRSILDSSPNDRDNAIDAYIIGDARKDKTNYIVEGSMWKWDPERYGKEQTFKVFTGATGQPPKILNPGDPLLTDTSISPDKIIDVPMSLRQDFENDVVKSLKDCAGIPSGSVHALISDYSKIERMFQPGLRNVYTGISAPAEVSPIDLIWNQVSEKFFIRRGNRYEFYYKPYLPRVVAVDQSFATDLTCISMGHIERYKETGDNIFVIDFTIPIIPTKSSKVNLEAIKVFIEDLRSKGMMNISAVGFDQFQSEVTMQNLKREGFVVDRISSDRTMDPYMNLSALMSAGRVAVGRNIFLKNNLKSLEFTRSKRGGKSKIDHDSSKAGVTFSSDESWETSPLGMYAKDVSDAVVGVVELCRRYFKTSEEVWWDSPEELEANTTHGRDLAREKLLITLKGLGLQLK